MFIKKRPANIKLIYELHLVKYVSKFPDRTGRKIWFELSFDRIDQQDFMTAVMNRFLSFFSIWPRWLMPRMYCSHIGLLYYPSTFQISPLVSFYEVLAARGGDVYEPSYFLIFPTFVTSRLQEILAAKGGTTWARNGR